MNNLEADVIVIGGGITGLGIARDAAMRGFKVNLLEQGELGSGTSGYFHSILHSGAKYAVVDPESAKECYQENQILRQMIPTAIVDIGGLFVAISHEDVEYYDKAREACRNCGIPTEEISRDKVLKSEPKITPSLKRAFTIPTAHINGEKTIALNKKAAIDLGVTILTNHKVTSLTLKNGRIDHVVTHNSVGEKKIFTAQIVINAAGIWASQIGKLADVTIALHGYKGSMIVFKKRFTRTYLNRCRMPADGDLYLPTENEYIIGTTSVKTDDIDTHTVEQWEIDTLLKEAEMMIPGISQYKITRAFAGVRPLSSSNSGSAHGRGLSRSFQILNHKKTDGIDNFISVVGGKFMIYRLMAERAVDEVCHTLGITRSCQTANTPL